MVTNYPKLYAVFGTNVLPSNRAFRLRLVLPAFFKNGNGFDSVFYCCVRVQPCHFRLLHTDKFFVVQLAVGGVGNVRNHSRAYGVA